MFSDRSTTELERYLAAVPLSPLTVVEAPSDEMAIAAANQIAAKVLGDALANDFRVVEPAGSAWTVDELSTEICSPAALKPTVRNVIVIVGADRMAPLTADKLLKTVEEPGADTLFLACCRDRNKLSNTILGRASSILELASPPPGEFVAALSVPDELVAAVEDCTPIVTVDPSLLATAVTEPDLLELLRTAVTALDFDAPAEAAAVAAVALEAAAALVDAPTPAAAKRRVCAAVLGAWVVTAAEQCHGNPAAIDAASRMVGRAEEAQRMLARGARPAVALFTALS